MLALLIDIRREASEAFIARIKEHSVGRFACIDLGADGCFVKKSKRYRLLIEDDFDSLFSKQAIDHIASVKPISIGHSPESRDVRVQAFHQMLFKRVHLGEMAIMAMASSSGRRHFWLSSSSLRLDSSASICLIRYPRTSLSPTWSSILRFAAKW